MKITKFHLAIILVLIFGCTDNNEISKSNPGSFALTQIKSPTNGRLSSTNEIVTDFDLGDLKASKEFYFILSNGGETPITDITLETDNPQFIITPQKISSLGETNSNENLIPLISLGVVHGVQLNGVGFTDVLDMGDNSTTLTITGKTIENGSTIELKSEFTFKVNAKKMDIILSENGNEIDILKPAGFTGWTNVGGLGTIPLYLAPSKTITIKNTGNVDLTITKRLLLTSEVVTQITLSPNQSTDLELKNDEINEFITIISVDGNGTIADNKRLLMGNDGKAYFSVQN